MHEFIKRVKFYWYTGTKLKLFSVLALFAIATTSFYVANSVIKQQTSTNQHAATGAQCKALGGVCEYGTGSVSCPGTYPGSLGQQDCGNGGVASNVGLCCTNNPTPTNTPTPTPGGSSGTIPDCPAGLDYSKDSYIGQNTPPEPCSPINGGPSWTSKPGYVMCKATLNTTPTTGFFCIPASSSTSTPTPTPGGSYRTCTNSCVIPGCAQVGIGLVYGCPAGQTAQDCPVIEACYYDVWCKPYNASNPNPNPLCSASTPTPTPNNVSTPVCGDGICNGSETCGTCAQDCGSCPVPTATTAPVSQPTATTAPVVTNGPTATTAPTSVQHAIAFNLHLTLNLQGIALGNGDGPQRVNAHPQNTSRGVTLYLYPIDSTKNGGDLTGANAIQTFVKVYFDQTTAHFSTDTNGQNGFPVGLSNFTGGTPQDGQAYDVYVKTDKYLRRHVGPYTIHYDQALTLTQPNSAFDLYAGDFDNDNVLSIVDYSMLISCYSTIDQVPTQPTLPIAPANAPICSFNKINFLDEPQPSDLDSFILKELGDIQYNFQNVRGE